MRDFLTSASKGGSIEAEAALARVEWIQKVSSLFLKKRNKCQAQFSSVFTINSDRNDIKPNEVNLIELTARKRSLLTLRISEK